ncbi:hypothetical protein H7J88_27140 [Mycolicibacterium flavescens]|uniref:hypothetical protein n=1 Tax=Mycolicibacterium flavescens TaxID=1776 RepID=UPI00197B915A|nr:hypothetical protein [Mycolicibacterium flavescens]MCV7283318.1 hypothetical protein [Mycolicibacterium flavescens]
MDTPTENRVLIDTGGLVVTDDGRRVLVIDRGTGPLTVLAFVLGVLAVVAGGFGLVALITTSPSTTVGAVFVAAGVALAVATFLVVRRIRRYRGRPLHECRPAAVLDRKLELFSYRGGALVQLDQVRFARKFQIGSSSPKLVAEMPGGTRILKRGNPFDGGVGNIDEVLNAVVREG